MAQTATTALKQPLPLSNLPWVDPKTGVPTIAFAQWATQVDAILRGALFGTLTSAANDAAAKAAGVPVNGLYRNGSAVQMRVT